MTERIYIVEDKRSDKARIIKATTLNQVVRHIVNGGYNIEPISALELANWLDKAPELKIEDATK